MPERDLAPEAVAYEAKEVQLLLSKEIVKHAFLSTEQRIVKQWQAAPDPESRERCWQKWNAFREWQQELRGLVDRTLHSGKE